MIISAPNPVLIPINDSSDSCTYCLQHYRLWYPGLIPFMVTRLPLYVQTVGELFIGQRQLWCCSPFFRPPVSLGVAHQASHILHIHNDHIHKRGSTELYFLTIFFIGLRPSSMTPIEDCSTQPKRLYAPFSSSAILLESSGMTPRTTILHRARHSDILSRSGHPLNSSMETKLYGYEEHMFLCLWIPREQRRDKLSLGYTSNITKKEDEYSYSLMSYFDIKRSFLICSRDKGDRHTPILIEDENLFTAFDDLPLDDT